VLVLILKFMGLIAGKSLQCAADSESVRRPKQGITLDRPDMGRNANNGVVQSARRRYK
jgi:hypothetical protein